MKCPFCKETIKSYANKCRYCGEWLNKKSPSKNSFKKLPFIIIIIAFLLTTFEIYSLYKSTKSTYPTTEKTTDYTCQRTEYEENEPEFLRIMSLYKQRALDIFPNNESTQFRLKLLPCIDIEYSDENDSEGFFFEVEPLNNVYKIYINRKYRNLDDVSMAIVFAHEISHLAHFVGKTPLTCYEKEVLAFYDQQAFVTQLNKEERDGIIAKILSGYYNQYDNKQLNMVSVLATFTGEAKNECNTNELNLCWSEAYKNRIRNYVQSNPYYQKQCGL